MHSRAYAENPQRELLTLMGDVSVGARIVLRIDVIDYPWTDTSACRTIIFQPNHCIGRLHDQGLPAAGRRLISFTHMRLITNYSKSTKFLLMMQVNKRNLRCMSFFVYPGRQIVPKSYGNAKKVGL